MEDRFEVQFASSENDFIYRKGINTGHTLSYNKVNRCLFLSSDARQLYINICSYAYGDKRECFPSQTRLRTQLGWSKQTLTNYIQELKEAGLIETTKRAGKPTLYYLRELHRIPVLIHSEIVYDIEKSFVNEELFNKAVAEYKKSSLFKEVSKADNPIEYLEKICEWFNSFLDGDVKETRVTMNVEESKPRHNLPKTFKIEGEMRREANPEKNKKPKKDKDPYKVPVEEWNVHHFMKYFETEYHSRFKVPYLTVTDDWGALSRLLEKRADSKEVLKKHIDNFLSLDFFEVKTLKNFTSSYIQTILDVYLNTGKLPSYKNKEKTKIQPEPSPEWKESLANLF